MDRYYALVDNSIVVGVVVADESFAAQLSTEHSAVIDVTDSSRPTPGDSYYPDVGAFVSNTQQVTDIPVDLEADHINGGSDDGFEPFNLSHYSVSYSAGVVTIGCKLYPAAGLLDTLHKLLVEKQQTTTFFTSSPEGPMHGKFGITWDDAQALYDKLSKVKVV